MQASHIRKLIKPIENAYAEMFSGQVFSIGEGAISVRNHSGPAENTVVCIHGFMENHCYFTQAYNAPTTELILITCSNYHVPVSGVVPQTPDWAVDIKHLAGTIEYDACILNQAMRNLIGSSNVRIHGHSRGAAVALEAIRQWPELYRDIELVLEAPILPQGRVHPLMLALLEPLSPSMWPWIVRLLNSTPNSAYNQTFFGKMNRRKKKLLSKLFHATKDHLTIVRNIDNLLAWMERTDTSVYQHITRGIVLIPATDRVLDRNAMLASARKGGENLKIVETTAPSHFIILDDKKWIPELAQIATADA